MRVAILHPWFLMRGGGEKVVDTLLDIYPDADVFTLFSTPSMQPAGLVQEQLKTSFLNSLPLSSKLHRHLMPLYPAAVESFDLTPYDLVISSCGPAMMGCNIRQDALHVCYCHTPQRSWWDLYANHQQQLSPLFRPFFVLGAGWVRTWEFAAIQRVDHILANSHFIADRVLKYFRRESEVIYPPVNITDAPLVASRGDYYLTVGRLEKQKRVDVLIHACNQLKRKLIIAGTGKEEVFLRSIAGPTIQFLGFVPDAELPSLFANCRAFLFAAIEDFGIAPVEAQGYGRPVIAYGFGGSLETVRVNDSEGRPDTGVFFHRQTAESVADALIRFENTEEYFVPQLIREHARQFDTQTFIDNLTRFIERAKEKTIPHEDRHNTLLVPR